MGSAAYKIFDTRGGSIGRLDSNDWALPDPDRFVSSRHAVVRFASGGFSLEDVSTNGTFLNGPDRAVARGEPTRLNDGDRVFIGDYEILVQLIDEASPVEPIPAETPLPVPAETLLPPLPPRSVAQAPSAGEFLPDAPGDVGSLGTDDPLAVIGTGARSPGSASPPPLPAQAAFGPRVGAAQPLVAEPRPMAMAQPAAQTVNARPSGITSRTDLSPGASEERSRDLYAALGLDARDVDPALAAQLGAIVRTVVQGMIEVLHARSQVKNNFRMPMTSIRAVENNPLKFSLDAADALHNLFLKRNPGYLGPVESFEEAFQDIAFHELAMLAGIRAAYQSMLAKFNPAQLEEEYTRKLRRSSVLPIGGRLKFWDMYCAQFEDVEKDAEGNFQLLFGEEFARAYHEQLAKLSQAAKLKKRER